MKDRDRIKERMKIVLGCLASFVLLAFVFFVAVKTNIAQGDRKSQSSLKEIEKRQELLLLDSGKSTWEYIDTGKMPDTDQKDPLAWTRTQYAAAGWKTAAGSFGSVKGELEQQAENKLPRNLLNLYQEDGRTVPVYCFRSAFYVEDLKSVSSLEGKILYDDSALIYLNGQLVYALNNPDNGYAQEGYGAKKTVDAPATDQFVISDLSSLKEGKNILAVELHQIHEGSSDIYFDLKYLKAFGEDVSAKTPVLDGLVLEPGKTQDSILVNWVSGEKGAYEIQWKEAAQESSATNGWKSILMGGLKTSINGMYAYTSSFDGLTAGLQYSYRVKSLADGSLSEEKSFTVPSGEGFTFCFAGDPQIGSGDLEKDGTAWSKALEAGLAAVPETAFVISAGDQIDSSDEDDAMREFMAFRDPETLKRLPVAVNRGNHESSQTGMDEQFQRFEGSDENYWFTYQDTLFYAINTNSKNYEEQLKRLRVAIREASPRWIVVTMHYSMFGGKDRSEDESVMNTRAAYAQAFSDLGVDIVLSGHDHLYSRSYLLYGESVTERESGVKNPGEVLYLSGGTSTGSKYYKKEDTVYPYTAFTDKERLKTLSFIKIEGDSLSLVTYSLPDMEIVDQCEISK